MSTDLNLNMCSKSNFNLTFLINMGASRWYCGNEKLASNNLSDEFKSKIPRNELFEISSMIFNITKHKREKLNDYKCYFDEKSNGLFVILTEKITFSEFTKEMMMNLFEFSEQVGIEMISLLVAKKNPQFMKIMKDLMVVGFKLNEKVKETVIEGDTYKVMEIPVNYEDKIEEFYFQKMLSE